MNGRKLIWADDDNRMALSMLRAILEEEGFRIHDFGNFKEAKHFLEDLRGREHLGNASLLVDVMMPRDASGKAPSPYVGLELAEFACRVEIGAVCFLTVISGQEVSERLESLRRSFPGIPVELVDKLRLLEDSVLESMIDFLRNPRQNDRAGAK